MIYSRWLVKFAVSCSGSVATVVAISHDFPGRWFGTFFIFPYIGNVMIPTDFHIFQRGRLNHQPVMIITIIIITVLSFYDHYHYYYY